MARCMLKAKNMPKEFWAETISCAIYLSNRSPTRSVKDKTPQETWSGRKPNVDHLRVFGSIAYAHVPQQERSKLDDRSVKHVFVGYDSNSKGYKLYNPSNGKVVVSRDVEFDEEAMWNWEAREEEVYDFFPYFDQETMVPIQETTPSSSPTHVAPLSSQESSSEKPRKIRSIYELLEETEKITNNDINDLFCLFLIVSL